MGCASPASGGRAVALIDIGLTNLDGYQVAARFRAELPTPPIPHRPFWLRPAERPQPRSPPASPHTL